MHMYQLATPTAQRKPLELSSSIYVRLQLTARPFDGVHCVFSLSSNGLCYLSHSHLRFEPFVNGLSESRWGIRVLI